jgi:hypothetical protein
VGYCLASCPRSGLSGCGAGTGARAADRIVDVSIAFDAQPSPEIEQETPAFEPHAPAGGADA